MTPSAALTTILDRLASLYGMPVADPDGDALVGLVGTILSQATTDRNAERAYRDLIVAFPDWEAVRDAPQADIAAAIQHGGLAWIKSGRIQAALRALTAILPPSDAPLAQRTAEWLQSQPVDAARQALQTLPGVGPKTAACVLLFHLGLPSMPVDTHVYRVSQRLGLFPTKTSLAHAHAWYDAWTPANLVFPLHILLITHGRRICRSRSPRCQICPLREICAYYWGNVASHDLA